MPPGDGYRDEVWQCSIDLFSKKEILLFSETSARNILVVDNTSDHGKSWYVGS